MTNGGKAAPVRIPSQDAPPSSNTDSARWSWGLSGLVVLLTLHPIVAADFWWQMARGRAVWEGHFAPSRELLGFEPNLDADFLGGLPWYLAFSLLGFAVLSCGLSLAAVLGANAVLGATGNAQPARSSGRQNFLRLALVFFGIAAARGSWSPTPALVDLCGVIATWILAGACREGSCRAQTAGLLLCELTWANLSTLPILGPCVAAARFLSATRDGGPPLTARRRIRTIALMLLAGSMTPRGIETFRDSLRVLLPWTCADLGTLAAAGMFPSWAWPPTSEVAAFLILCGLCLFLCGWQPGIRRRSAWLGRAMILLAALIAASSPANLGPIAVWLMLWALESSSASVPGSQTGNDNAHRVGQPAWSGYLGAVALAAFAIAVGGGFWPGSQTRLGWGLAPQLEPALTAQALEAYQLDGTAYCSGIRETGILAWLRPGSIRPADAPPRALLSGRLKEHVRNGSDLAEGWRDQHRRADGSWGGWWIPLQERHTRLLLISPEALDVIRALETSNWKPLAIDSPSLPYGLAGDPELSPGMVHILAVLRLVEYGAWTYPLPAASGAGSHFDLCGWITGRHDLRIDLRQARTLRAMERHIAALRVLHDSLSLGDPEARQEFASNQLALAYREFLTAGQATRWRTLAYIRGGGDPHFLRGMRALGAGGENVTPPLPEGFSQALTDYARGDLQSAGKALTGVDPESLFALSQISLEAGDPRQAARVLQKLLLDFPDSAETLTGRHVLTQISD